MPTTLSSLESTQDIIHDEDNYSDPLSPLIPIAIPTVEEMFDIPTNLSEGN